MYMNMYESCRKLIFFNLTLFILYILYFQDAYHIHNYVFSYVCGPFSRLGFAIDFCSRNFLLIFNCILIVLSYIYSTVTLYDFLKSLLCSNWIT